MTSGLISWPINRKAAGVAGILLGSVLCNGASLAQAQRDARLSVRVELPELSVAEYHEPYIAIWIADERSQVRANLAVWYMLGSGPEGDGDTWLKDLRQWWRRSGRRLAVPLDGVTAATRSPGVHKLEFLASEAPLSGLEPGNYELIIEAVREVGDRELLRLPFNWGQGQSVSVSAEGSTELGLIDVEIRYD